MSPSHNAERRTPHRWHSLGSAMMATGVAAALLLGGASPAPTAVAGHPRTTHPVGVEAPPGAPITSISVSGNHLVNGSGQIVQLRGANVSGTEFSCIQGGNQHDRGWSIYGDQPLNLASTYQAMVAWGINAVRVPLNEDCWLGINGVNPAYGGAAYRSAIAAEVTQINAAGMVAILDLHWSSPGPWAAYDQQSMADAGHSLAFWSSVATAYRADPAVIFDLYNEPFFYYIVGGTPQWQCWLEGCEQSTVVTAYQIGPRGEHTGYTTPYRWKSAGMNELIAAIRRTGATQPVMANGVNWANDDSGWLANRPTDPAGQLIAGWHSYPGENCASETCWNQTIAPIAQSYPVVIGETGDNTWTTPTYMPTLLPWADANGISYLPWTWNPWQYSANVLITNWAGTPTPGEGAYYQSHLLGLARR